MELSKKQKIEKLLTRGVSEVIKREHLKNALLKGEKLRVKYGIDPTAADLHLGHSVQLRKLREFQDLGCKALLVIGDFTAKIGDPSGKSETRKPLTDKEIKTNLKSYLGLAAKIIDVKKAEIFYNSKWFLKEGVKEMLELAGATTMQQVLKRADFKERLAADEDITLPEVFYSVFQGYDSVKTKSDVELGGVDQKLNLLMGRRVQRHYGMEEQDILITPLLVGTDGSKKMSKSLGNYIGLNDSPNDMFGKIMAIPDELMEDYFLLCTGVEEKEFLNLKKTLPLRDLKVRLGYEIVKLYHGENAAKKAQEFFEVTFSKKGIGSDILEFKTKKKISVLDLVMESRTVKSKSEARRLILQGGVKLNDLVRNDPGEVLILKGGEVFRVGRRNFFKISV